MDWTEVFYIADHREMYEDAKVTSHLDEDHAYSLMVRPNSYFNQAKHYSMNGCTSYEKCLELVSSYVTRFGSPENFFDKCMGFMDGFRVESKPELARRIEYYDTYYEDIIMCDEDIKAAICEGKKTRIISGANISVTITNAETIGGCELVSMTGKQEWIDWTMNALFNPILSFGGHTKRELYHLLENEFDVDIFNEMLGEFKKHGVKSIKILKTLSVGDLALCLADFVNDFDDEEV